MTDLLIGIAVDFDGSGRAGGQAERIAESFKPGVAGDVRWAVTEGAALIARARAPRAAPRIKPWRVGLGPDGGVTLFAGRLFERDRLADQLSAAGPAEDDATLYAAAHARFGEECDRRLVGDYAAIRWLPAQRRLRMARSPTSRHPLHLWRDGAHLVAASIPRALFAAGAPDRLDPAILDDYLMMAGPFMDQSFYAACARVPAAHVLTADARGERMRQYWSIRTVREVRFQRDDDYVDAVDEQLHRALAAELHDAKAPAVSLSGGLDSQAVATYALDVLPASDTLKTFTSVPMGGWTPPARAGRFGDESAHVRALAAMYPRLEAHYVTAAEARFGESLNARTALSSWPSYNELNAHWSLAIGKAAARAGCDILLSGDFGNVSFSYDGLTGFADWFARGRWRRLAREVALSNDERSFPRALFSRAIWPHVPNRLRRWRDRDNPWHVSAFESWCPMREDHAAATAVVARARGRGVEVDGYDPRGPRPLRDDMWRWMASGAGEVVVGQTLLNGIELADPTAFTPLVELCAGIPDEQYLRDGTDRWLARRLLAGKVPEMVRRETRTGAQSADWPVRISRDRAGLIDELDQLGADGRLAQVFDFERMKRTLEEWDGTDDPAGRNFFAVAICATRGIAAARFVRFVEGRNV